MKNAYLLGKIGADTAENEQHFAEILPIGRRVAASLGPPAEAAAAAASRSAAARACAAALRCMLRCERCLPNLQDLENILERAQPV